MTTGLGSTPANAILNALCRNVSWTQPAAFYVKLHTGDPGSAGTSNAAGNTTRKSVSFAAASDGAIASNADCAWTNVSTSETYTHVSFWDASSNGNFLGSDALDTSRAVVAGDDFTIPSGSISLSLSPIAA